MIEKLTSEQESKIPQYLDQYLKIGLDTAPVDRKKAEEVVSAAYRALKQTPPTKFFWFDSPFAAESAMKKAGVSFSRNYGSFEAYWVSTYAFVAKELFPTENQSLIDAAIAVVKECGVYYAFEKGAVLTEKPVGLYFNSNKQLHRLVGPAIEYKDGTGVYALNGIRIPKEFGGEVETINPIDVMRIVDVDVRREVMRKVGVTKMLEAMNAKLLDTFSMNVGVTEHVYELYELNLGDGLIARALKMKNPSIDAYHVEGVPDEIKTCKEAIAWRNGFDKFVPPTELT